MLGSRKRYVFPASLMLGILLLAYSVRYYPQEPCPPKDAPLDYMVKMRFHLTNYSEKYVNDLGLLRNSLMVAICMVICNNKDCGHYYTVSGELPSGTEAKIYYYEVYIPQQPQTTMYSIIKQCERIFELFFTSHLQIAACSVSIDPVRYEVNNEE